MTAVADLTLAADLERCRLEHRIVRTERVLDALRDRERSYAASGDVPVPLRAAIRDFGAELGAMRLRLQDVGA